MSRVLAALGLLLATAPTFASPAAPPVKSAATGRFVVKLKQSAPPAVLWQLAKALPAKLVTMDRGGNYLLVVPNKGVTAKKLEKADPRIAYVEPEMTYGATFRLEDARLAAK